MLVSFLYPCTWWESYRLAVQMSTLIPGSCPLLTRSSSASIWEVIYLPILGAANNWLICGTKAPPSCFQVRQLCECNFHSGLAFAWIHMPAGSFPFPILSSVSYRFFLKKTSPINHICLNSHLRPCFQGILLRKKEEKEIEKE